MRKLSRLILGVALLSLPLPALAQVNPIWTAVASTGTVDEANYNPVNFSFAGSGLSFLGASIQPAIVARYNVTNIAGLTNPPWTTLELGALDSSTVAGNQVTARLIQVKPCNGGQQILCTATSITTPIALGTCTSCNFSTAIDFTQFLYYVEVTVQRTAANITEQALTLRIF